MASTVDKARSKLPKRFRPYYDQAQTETAIRYGAAQDALGSIFGQTTRNYQRQAAAQQTMAQSLLGSLGAAGGKLDKAYSDAGLTPELRGQIANSPTGQRIASELASGQADIQDQLTGVQAGQQYIQGDLADKYREDVGAINQQLRSLLTERGLFEQNRLGSLIGEDRARRSDINAAARKAEFDASQAILDRDASMGNALIGQGLVMDEKGNLVPLPGGKADPNAPGNKPKRTTGPGTATKDAQTRAGTSFRDAVAIAAGMAKGKPASPELRERIASNLRTGRKASGGAVIYDEVPDPTRPGGVRQVPRIEPAKLPDGSPNPNAGQRVTSPEKPGVKPFDAVIAAAATEQAMFKYVTTATVRELQKLGYSVRQFPGLKTESQWRREHPRKPTPASVTRPTARSRDQQPG